jgi:hypothetical protein
LLMEIWLPGGLVLVGVIILAVGLYLRTAPKRVKPGDLISTSHPNLP